MAIATERKIGFSILGPEKIARIHEASLHLVEMVACASGRSGRASCWPRRAAPWTARGS